MSTTVFVPDIARRLRQPAAHPNFRYLRMQNMSLVVGATKIPLSTQDFNGTQIIILSDFNNTGLLYVGGANLNLVNGFTVVPGSGVCFDAMQDSDDIVKAGLDIPTQPSINVISLKDLYAMAPGGACTIAIVINQWSV